MVENSFDRERELFDLCVTLSPQEWDVALADACPDDTRLRQRVRRLLERHHASDETGGYLRLGPSDPTEIGPYRVLQRLGEGGMGVVYSAEQREPVRRRVAVKVLRSGHNSREVLARFEAERQALALMSHPNIASILDAGTTADNRPYIVMEYVPGESILHYCESRDLPLEQRLRLMQQVCEAVQHAHQKGVIHRDLKPTNVLVTEENGRAIPKIIDFGIAKALTVRLTEHTLETRVGSLLGTPDYMSPEQADPSPLDVDTRADVYALGVLLYRLLTGTTPLNLADRAGTFAEIQHAIREIEPPRPSERVSGGLAEALRKELDWITLKALEKDRNRRYASAAEFGADIGRYLNGEIPVAGAHTLAYRAGKFARQHAVAVTGVLGVILLLSAFSALMAWQVHQTGVERDRANRQAETARRVTRFTASLFELANPEHSGTPDVTARELLDTGMERLEQQMRREPVHVRAALLQAAADAYHGLGEHEMAEQLVGRAIALHRESTSPEPEAYAEALISLAYLKLEHNSLEDAAALAHEAAAQAELLSDPRLRFLASVCLADVLRGRKQFDDAATLLEPAIAAIRTDMRIEPHELANALILLGRIRTDLGKFDEAEQVLIEASLTPRNTASRVYELARSALGTMYATRGDHDRAIAINRELAEAATRRYGENHPETATALNNLGFALAAKAEMRPEAADVLRAAMEIQERLRGADHTATLRAQSNLAWIYRATEQYDRAHETYSDLLEKRIRLLGENHVDTANAQAGLAGTLHFLGRPAEAETLFRKALDVFRTTYGEDHWRTAGMHSSLGTVLQEMGRLDDAQAEFQLAYDVFRETFGEDDERTQKAREKLQQPAPQP